MTLRLCFQIGLLSAVVSCAACKGTPSHEISSDVHRVVSLSPSTTETMAAIGALDLLVGRSRYCDFPIEVQKLPQVGGFIDPNFEAILALRPDLVIGARGPSGPKLSTRLAAEKVPIFFPQTETLEEIYAMIEGVGARVRHEAQAKGVITAMQTHLSAINDALLNVPKPHVLFVFGLRPVSVAGEGSFADEILRRAGAVNVVHGGGAYPILDMERVLALDPDIVLNAAFPHGPNPERVTEQTPGWRELRATRLGKVLQVEDEAVLRPGPRVVEAVAILARLVHPGVSIP